MDKIPKAPMITDFLPDHSVKNFGCALNVFRAPYLSSVVTSSVLRFTNLDTMNIPKATTNNKIPNNVIFLFFCFKLNINK